MQRSFLASMLLSFLSLGAWAQATPADEEKVLVGLDVKMVQDKEVTGEKKNVMCFGTELIMDRESRLYKAVIKTYENNHDSMDIGEKYLCVFMDKISKDEQTELSEGLQAIPQEARAAAIERGLVPVEDVVKGNADAVVTPEGTNDDGNSRHRTAMRMLKGEGVFLGVGAVGVTMLWFMPADISKWDPDRSKRAKKIASSYKRAFTQAPVWDHDEWWINWVTHPYWGAQYYLSMRNRGESRLNSFIFSTMCSLTWEYAIESVAERPSINDMLFTSTIGSALGEGSYQLTRLMKRHGFNTLEKIALTVINPTYVLQHGYK